MASSTLTALVHGILALALLAGYVTLTILGHDATNLLAVLGGQLGGLGVSNLAQSAGNTPAPDSPPRPSPAISPSPPAQ